MKKFKLFTIFAVAFLSVCSLSAFDFAKNGKALCVIAVPENCSDLEIIAKDDLSGILEKITGAKFQVVPESQVKGPAIYLGFTNYAKANGVDFSKLENEEWVIRTSGKNLILTGGGIVGPFYAVQALLRKMGYYMLTMDQEVIPQQKTLSLANPDEQKKPAFKGRYIHDAFPETALLEGMGYEKAKAYNMWLLRNYQNGQGQNACRLRPYYIGDHNNVFHFPFFHSLMAYVPPAKYFKTHPEYYSMDATGKRIKPRTAGIGGSLCMSNPEVAKVTAENMLAMIRKDRKLIAKEFCPKIYDLSLLDDFGYICYCPECKKVIEAHGGDKNGGTTALMLLYSNDVAARVAKEYPDVIIRIFAYSCGKLPCKTVKPVKNILVQYCDLFSSGDSYRPLTSKFNKNSYKYLTDWSASGAELMIWDYWNLPQYNPRPETIIDTIQPDLQLFHKLGVTNLFIEAELEYGCPQNFMFMQYFIGCQMMMDPYQDVEKLIDTYLRGYYGDAAPVMKEYLNALRAGVKTHPNLQISIRIERWHYLTSDFLVSWYKKLTAAERALPENSVYRARVQAEKLPLMWFACQNASASRKAFANAGIKMDDLEKETHAAALKFLHRHGFKRTAQRSVKKFEEAWELVSAKIPVPEMFKAVPEERIRVLGYPLYRRVPSHNTNTVPDKDATCGKALKSANKSILYHGPGKVIKEKSGNYIATAFYLANIGSAGKVGLELKKVPQDEKYHWYRIPGTYDMNSLAYFWGHSWGLQMNISHVYTPTDGVHNLNKWQGWVRAKFTGPAYVPGSKQENAIWVDVVVLTRPGEPSLSKYPAGGLIK